MNRRERMTDREASKTLTRASKGGKVTPVDLERAKATAADHYRLLADDAERRK